METESRCSFCQRLPARTKGGKPAKCPVCKGALLVAAETTYRLVTAEEMALEPKVAGSRRWKPAALLALAACLVLTAWLGKQYTGGNGPVFEIPVVPVPDFTARDALPVEGALAMVPTQERPIPAASQPEMVAARKPQPILETKTVAKTIANDLPEFPRIKSKGSFSAGSYFEWYNKKPGSFADQAEEFERLGLLEAPEIDLVEPAKIGDKAKIADRMKDILKLTKDDPDAFVRQIKKRADFAGLPFVMGEKCRLEPKQARSLQSGSRSVRMGLDRTRQVVSKDSYYDQSRDSGHRFWVWVSMRTEALPALEQILLASFSAP